MSSLEKIEAETLRIIDEVECLVGRYLSGEEIPNLQDTIEVLKARIAKNLLLLGGGAIQ